MKKPPPAPGRTPRAGAGSPHLRAFAVIAGVARRGSIPPRPDSAASYPPQTISGYLSKNPVNLSIFTEFFGNSISGGRSDRLRHHTAVPEAARAANAGKCGAGPGGRRSRPPRSGRRKASQPPRLLPDASFPVTANAGKCAPRAAPGSRPAPAVRTASAARKTKADGRPLQHTPTSRKPGGGKCGQMCGERERRVGSIPTGEGLLKRPSPGTHTWTC